MKLWHRIFGLRNGIDEIEPLRAQYSDSAMRVQENARRLARSVEEVSRQKKHDNLEQLVRRFRICEGQD